MLLRLFVVALFTAKVQMPFFRGLRQPFFPIVCFLCFACSVRPPGPCMSCTRARVCSVCCCCLPWLTDCTVPVLPVHSCLFSLLPSPSLIDRSHPQPLPHIRTNAAAMDADQKMQADMVSKRDFAQGDSTMQLGARLAHSPFVCLDRGIACACLRVRVAAGRRFVPSGSRHQGCRGGGPVGPPRVAGAVPRARSGQGAVTATAGRQQQRKETRRKRPGTTRATKRRLEVYLRERRCENEQRGVTQSLIGCVGFFLLAAAADRRPRRAISWWMC